MAAPTVLTHLPNAGLIVRPVSGHLVFVEEPAWFNEIVAEFVHAPQSVLTHVAAAPHPLPSAPAGDWWAHARAVAPGMARTHLTPRGMATASLCLAVLLAVQYTWQHRAQNMP